MLFVLTVRTSSGPLQGHDTRLIDGSCGHDHHAITQLQGLLEKDFRHRLDWPRLAQHPFVNLDEQLAGAGNAEVPTRIAGLEAIVGAARSL